MLAVEIANESWLERCRALWRGPRSFTSVVPFDGLSAEDLRARLKSMEDAFCEAAANIEDCHSFRLVMVLPSMGDGGGVVRLLLNVVYDIPRPEFFADMLEHMGSLLVSVFEGAAFSGESDDIPRLLMACRAPEQTLFISECRTVAQIKEDRRLREVVQDYVNQEEANGTWRSNTPCKTIRTSIRQYCLEGYQGNDIPRDVSAGLSLGGRFWRGLDLLVSFMNPLLGSIGWAANERIRLIKNLPLRWFTWCAYGLWWLYAAIPTALAFLGIRLLEALEPEITPPSRSEAELTELESRENLSPTSEVTIWFPVRESWMRRLFLRLILHISNTGCRHFWNKGALAGIETIHYARIMQVDGGKFMLFMTDYEGGLGRYLDDFLGVGQRAVVAITSNLKETPKTHWAYQKANPKTFAGHWVAMIRANQLASGVWYSPYSDLSPREIRDNARLRDGLFASDLTPAEARDWVRSL